MAPSKSKAAASIYMIVTSTGVDSVYATLEGAQECIDEMRAHGSSARLEVQSIIGGSVLIDEKLTKSEPGAAKRSDVKAKSAQTAASSGDARKGRKPKAASKDVEDDAAALGQTDDKDEEVNRKPAHRTVPADKQRAANAKKDTKSADEDLPANVQELLASGSDVLSGLKVVVTGVPPTIGRKNAERLVEGHGGKLLKSISGKTDLVVLGNEAGPKKLEQIEELKIETIDEDELIERLEAGGASKKRAAEDENEDKPAAKVKRNK